MFFFNGSVEAGNGRIAIPVPDYYREKAFSEVMEGAACCIRSGRFAMVD